MASRNETSARSGDRGTCSFELLARTPSGEEIQELALLLQDAVEGDSAVSFLRPLGIEVARAWWRTTIEGLPERGAVFVARDSSGIVGTVQLQPAWAPNQPHRAEIAKLMVHRRSRRRGIATRLMEEVERFAAVKGLRLLTLDTRRGEPSEALYRGLAWNEVGIIPKYALNPDGRDFHDTVVFYKEVGSAEGSDRRQDSDR